MYDFSLFTILPAQKQASTWISLPAWENYAKLALNIEILHCF